MCFSMQECITEVMASPDSTSISDNSLNWRLNRQNSSLIKRQRHWFVCWHPLHLRSISIISTESLAEFLFFWNWLIEKANEYVLRRIWLKEIGISANNIDRKQLFILVCNSINCWKQSFNWNNDFKTSLFSHLLVDRYKPLKVENNWLWFESTENIFQNCGTSSSLM